MKRARSFWLGGIAMLIAVVSFVRAHDVFAEYVWHRVELSAGARQVDVTVTLTFFEHWSERERRRMDADHDGRIGRTEIANYGANLASALKSRVTLSIDGERVALVPLYAPEVDLLGRVTIEGVRHQLTLHYFAALPRALAPGAVIVVEDHLWSEAHSFGEIEATTRGGGDVFKIAGDADHDRSSGGSDGVLRFTVKTPRNTGAQ